MTQANLWVHLQFQKNVGILFYFVAKVILSVKLIKCQERELKFPLPCQAGITLCPFGKGVNNSKTAYEGGNKIHIATH